MNPFDLNDPRLTAFALGELPEHERLEIERLLEESAEARAALAEIQDTIDLVKGELAAEPVPALTSSQRQAIEAQLAASLAAPSPAQPAVTLATEHEGERVSLSWRWLSLGLTAAALVGIALVLPRDPQRDAVVSVATIQDDEKEVAEVAMTARHSLKVEAGRALDESGENKSLDKLSVVTRSTLLNEAQESEGFGGKQMAGRPTSDDSNKSLPYRVATKTDREIFGAGVTESPPISDASRLQKREKLNESVVAQGSGASRAMRRNVVSDDAPAAPLVATAPIAAGAAPAAAPPAEKIQALAKRKPVVSSAPTNGERMRALNSSRGAAVRLEDEAKSNDAKFAAGSRAVAAEARDGTAPSAGLAAPAFGVEGKPAEAKAASGPTATVATARKLSGLAENEKGKADTQLALREDARKKLDEKTALGLDALSLQRESREQAPNTEAYEAITENEFLVPQESPLSTFSIDVDSASYANMRRFLTQGQLPPPSAIRVEELVNYFSYQYAQPADGQPFSVLADAAPCPWSKDNYIARIGLKARDIDKAKRPPTNLVFLIDVSGSMATPNKLPLVKRGMSLLVEEMSETDRISIVTYAGDAGLKLEPTTGNEQARIMTVIDGLNAGGSTNGAAGINLAYEQALRHFNKEAANRVILCTDGDFNVGISSDDELVKLIQTQAKTGVYLSIFGFGMGNLKDSKLEKLADKGNGHYGYIDDLNEARKVFNEELVGTLYTVAKDVKLQVEFNPLTVGAYRLIGYENRTLAAQDFNDDTKDAGEIGAGHTVTALYEIVPVGKWPKPSGVDPLKYAAADKAADRKLVEAKDAAKKVPADVADDLFTVKLRYKLPDAETSVKTIDYVVDDIAGKKIVPSNDLMWAASVANFGMQLRRSKHAGQWKLDDIAETASGLAEGDRTGRRAEFVELVKKAAAIKGR